MKLLDIAADGYFRFLCPACGQRLKARPDQVGRAAPCPNCHQVGQVPRPGHAPEATRLRPPCPPLPPPPDPTVLPAPGPSSEYVGTFHAILNSLPPLHCRKSPTLSAVLALLGGGLCLAVYFVSFIDLIVLVFEAALLSVLVAMSGMSPEEKWGTGLILGNLLASLYGYFRALNSNRRLGPSGARGAWVNVLLAAAAFLTFFGLLVVAIGVALAAAAAGPGGERPSGAHQQAEGQRPSPDGPPPRRVDLGPDQDSAGPSRLDPPGAVGPPRPSDEDFIRWLTFQNICLGDGAVSWRIDPGEVSGFRVVGLDRDAFGGTFTAAVAFTVHHPIKDNGGEVEGRVRYRQAGLGTLAFLDFTPTSFVKTGHWEPEKPVLRLHEVYTASVRVDGKVHTLRFILCEGGKFIGAQNARGDVIDGKESGTYGYDKEREVLSFYDSDGYLLESARIEWVNDRQFEYTILNNPANPDLRGVKLRYTRQ
jgi:hypothetical protein